MCGRAYEIEPIAAHAVSSGAFPRLITNRRMSRLQKEVLHARQLEEEQQLRGARLRRGPADGDGVQDEQRHPRARLQPRRVRHVNVKRRQNKIECVGTVLDSIVPACLHVRRTQGVFLAASSDGRRRVCEQARGDDCGRGGQGACPTWGWHSKILYYCSTGWVGTHFNSFVILLVHPGKKEPRAVSASSAGLPACPEQKPATLQHYSGM